MTKTFKLEELDCANCAAKMEDAVGKLPGVENARISFMQQQLTLQAPDDGFDALVKQAQKVMRKIEPDVRILV